ncbi:MAG: hypothetical protein F4227_08515 [Gammaproteobacteria bacterium]|nr:hypothetical protein [Gammaproteobacteria bacterium]MYF02992.1 hypothetical protein [Gammaproteobacteria bacterium]MYI78099.1 hypothetical protein [Gammaproteobacteria bacterium]
MNEDTRDATHERNPMTAPGTDRRSNILRAVWIGWVAISSLSVQACNTIEELEIPEWTTADFYDAIERDDAKSVREYLSDTTRATKDFLSHYLLDYALELGRDDIASLMVEAGAGLNTQLAVQHENVLILEEMLNLGVEPQGASLAAEVGNLQMLNLLLSYGEDDLSTEKAARTGHTEAIKLLLQHGAKPEGLGIASLHGQVDVAKLLLDAGADPNELTRRHLERFDLEFDIPKRYMMEYLSPLHHAVLSQSRELVELLLENGADPNVSPNAVTLQKNSSSRQFWPTVLQVATDLLNSGDASIAKLLIKHGAATSVSVDDEGIHLARRLYSAAKVRDYEAVVRLIEDGARPTGFGDILDAHHRYKYNPKIITAFFDAGADPNTYRGRSYMEDPAVLTLKNGDVDNFRRFAESGLDVYEPALSWYGKIACVRGLNAALEVLWTLGIERGPWELVIPVNYGHVHMVEFLLYKGMRPDFLRRAVKSERVEIVRLLLEAGADPNEPDDRDENSILEVAQESGNEHIIGMLKIAGATE